MYRDEILDLYKNPRNTGEIENAELKLQGENPSCGDQLTLYVNRDDKITDIKHDSDACAICTASTSILTEEVKGLPVREVGELDKNWMLEKLGIDVSPMRLKCALLGLETLQKGLEE